MALETEVTLKILSVLTALICIKFFFVILGSGGKRTRAPEDGFQFKKPLKQNEADDNEDGFDNEQRWKRIVQNDMENIPITITLLWIAVYINGNNEANVACAGAFLFGRTMHTISMIQNYVSSISLSYVPQPYTGYIYGLQPWRTIGWFFGFISTLGFIGNIVYGAFQ